MARRRSSSEFAPLQSSPLSAPLSPPRPTFYNADSHRSSGSDFSSGSDSEQPPPRAQKTRRRSSGMASSYAPVAATTPTSPSFTRRINTNPFETSDSGHGYGFGSEDHELSPTFNPANLYHNLNDRDIDEPIYQNRRNSRSTVPPPSSFQFPFQSHPGNPDPIPRRRSNSFDSLTQRDPPMSSDDSHSHAHEQPLHPPNAGFRGRSASSTSLNGLNSASSVYRNSAAAGMAAPVPIAPFAMAPGTSSAPGTPPLAFRAPFLSPASRPTSSLWTPPTYPYATPTGASNSALALSLPAPPAPAPSTRLAAKLSKEEKPWLQRSPPRARASWWLTFFCMFLGVAGAALLCFFGITGVDTFSNSQLCMVLEDNFDTFDLQNTWTREVQLGGFGNGEFQIASSFDNNSYVQNGELYIMPTLTSDWLGESAITSGSVTLDPCTLSETNKTACSAAGDGNGQIINPVMTARINTQAHYSIQYGRVEVSAKLPRGDWLWPAIWMLPVNGTWPLDGEMDLMEARGNGPAYTAQGSNFVRSTVQYGPFAQLVARTYGWFGLKRTSFDKGFHTYGLEWDDTWMRFYVDSQVKQTLYLKTKTAKQSFWNRAGFPATIQNGTSVQSVKNPYTAINAPFDKPFYLIIDLAVGGTSGWFPDHVGGKPWLDGSLTAMNDFWQDKNNWYSTWPKDAADGAFRIDSVKMWKKC